MPPAVWQLRMENRVSQAKAGVSIPASVWRTWHLPSRWGVWEQAASGHAWQTLRYVVTRTQLE